MNKSEYIEDELPALENIIDIQPANEQRILGEPVNLQLKGTSHEKSSNNYISVTQEYTSEQTSTKSVYLLVTHMAKSGSKG